jgi:hypothetical protein
LFVDDVLLPRDNCDAREDPRACVCLIDRQRELTEWQMSETSRLAKLRKRATRHRDKKTDVVKILNDRRERDAHERIARADKRLLAQLRNGTLLKRKVKNPQRALGELVSMGRTFAARREQLTDDQWECWLDNVPLDTCRHMRELMILADLSQCESPQYIRVAVRLLKWCNHDMRHADLENVIRGWLIVDWENTAGGKYKPRGFIPGDPDASPNLVEVIASMRK